MLPLVFIQRLQETRKNIVKRNIVIAGNDDLRLGKASRKARASRTVASERVESGHPKPPPGPD